MDDNNYQGGQRELSDPVFSSGATDDLNLMTSMARCPVENDLRYHWFHEGAYHFPNSRAEQERELQKHYIIGALMNNSLHLAPLENNPGRVLDVGTGIGRWAIEMGYRYPSAGLLGVDLSKIQPGSVPPNVRFLMGDIEDNWPWGRDYFRYIHARHTVQAIKDRRKLIQQSFNALEPGGWIEFQDFDHYPSCREGNPDLPSSKVNEALLNLGVVSRPFPQQSPAVQLEEVGFVNVHHISKQIPIGPWPEIPDMRYIGPMWYQDHWNGLRAIAMGPLTRGLGLSAEEVDSLVARVRSAYYWLQLDPHGPKLTMPFHVIIGQKPCAGLPLRFKPG